MQRRIMVACCAALAMVSASPPAWAQAPISGKFYRYQVVGAPGLGEVTGTIAAGPSINKLGQVAFVGNFNTARAVFVTDIGANPPPAGSPLVRLNSNLGFQGGVQINDAQHLAAVSQFPVQEPNGFFKMHLRDYNAAPPGPYPNTLIAGANDPAANDFQQLRFEAALNNAGQPAFSGTRYLPNPPGGAINALATGIRPTINRLDLPHSLRPMVADNGRVAVRAGNAATNPIR